MCSEVTMIGGKSIRKLQWIGGQLNLNLKDIQILTREQKVKMVPTPKWRGLQGIVGVIPRIPFSP